MRDWRLNRQKNGFRRLENKYPPLVSKNLVEWCLDHETLVYNSKTKIQFESTAISESIVKPS